MELELTLYRIFFAPTYTIGKLYINNVYFCDTLEDVNIDKNKDGKFNDGFNKVKHKTCIPFGIYKVLVTLSNRFKKLLPLLFDVNEFDGIRIHAGNTDSDTSGCILVGENKVKGKLINSLKYANELTDLIYKEQLKGIKTTIKIV